jgi:dCMP deaminase
VLSWFKDKNRPKNDYLNHAEVNAIANKKEATIENCIMYVTSFPCIECSKLIAQSGIAKVVYLEDACCQTLNEKEIAAARILLQLAGVILIKFQ